MSADIVDQLTSMYVDERTRAEHAEEELASLRSRLAEALEAAEKIARARMVECANAPAFGSGGYWDGGYESAKRIAAAISDLKEKP